jgi:hypothetical protein
MMNTCLLEARDSDVYEFSGISGQMDGTMLTMILNLGCMEEWIQ